MQNNQTSRIRGDSPIENESQIPFSSNSIRLSLFEWLVAAIIFTLICCFAPGLWERLEKFEPGPDYRIPYDLSSNYWLYDRYCRWACSHYETLIIGDSVIWGHYVSKDNTLSHYLNENAGRSRFANLGVDGTHPAALEGLIKYYGRSISNKNVILHLNLLWMSSPKADLQIEKEHHFNHPKLVPQFNPKIPCYTAPFLSRALAVAQRHVPFLGWKLHLKTACDLPSRTLVSEDTQSDKYDKRRSIIKPVRGDFQGVQLETSLQWGFFRRSIEILKARGNRVFVLVGPFNEHRLKPESLKTYITMRDEIEAWLKKNNIVHYVPSVLPAEFYTDASHPLNEGYAELAKQLFENDSFKSTILEPSGD